MKTRLLILLVICCTGFTLQAAAQDTLNADSLYDYSQRPYEVERKIQMAKSMRDQFDRFTLVVVNDTLYSGDHKKRIEALLASPGEITSIKIIREKDLVQKYTRDENIRQVLAFTTTARPSKQKL